MTVSLLVEQVLFVGVFLALVTIIHELTKKIKVIPFTVALLGLGFAGQALLYWSGAHLPVTMSPDFIYFVLLPLLLFGAAMHLNLHQFRLQFKTITFMATFGLLVGIMVVGTGVSLLAGIPWWDSLLFGALISATDPIAVLSIFQQLGAPRRLALLADGESMFNDATAVIVFRILAGVVLAGEHVSSILLISGLGELLYVFVGSIVAGAGIGYLISQLIAWIKDDPLVETTLTLVAALMAFAAMEHYFHLSGVISAVVAGLVMGNWGRARFSASVIEFVKTFWDYLGFLAVAIVFFFSALEMDLNFFVHNPGRIALVVLVVLLARAVSVYTSFWITNKSWLFANEPDVSLAWQHILNWGGLRGVIPLVLVFSLPHEYIYREQILGFTLATFLFTLFINGMTIEWLLKRLKLHHPRVEEAIIKEEEDIFRAEEARKKLHSLPKSEFKDKLCDLVNRRINKEIDEHEKILKTHIRDAEQVKKSLRLQTIHLQHKILHRLFREGSVSEDVMFDFETQLDLRADAMEYPEKFEVRGLNPKGEENGEQKYLVKLAKLKKQEGETNGVFKRWFRASWEELVIERYSLLRVRVIAAREIVEYLARVERVLGNYFAEAVEVVTNEYEQYVRGNTYKKQEIEREYPGLVESYRQELLDKLVGENGATSAH